MVKNKPLDTGERSIYHAVKLEASWGNRIVHEQLLYMQEFCVVTLRDIERRTRWLRTRCPFHGMQKLSTIMNVTRKIPIGVLFTRQVTMNV